MILEQILISNKPNRSIKTVKNSETAMRSVVKAFSWRIVGTLDTVLISWLVIGDVSMAFAIGSVELITKMLLYFFHERIWNIIKWGKQ